MEVKQTYDLLVIGGGPAGTSCAITAAEAGLRVLLLESGRFPRHKVCGEFVSAESLELLSDLLRGSMLLTNPPRIAKARVFSDRREYVLPVAPPAASISRYDLDQALWNVAIERGVHAHQQCRVTTLSKDRDLFLAVTPRGTFAAHVAVVCAGRWSNLDPSKSDALDAGPKWIGVKAHFAEQSPSQSVDLYFFKGGYCGVQPVGADVVNACAMVRSDVATDLAEVFEQSPELKGRSQKWTQLFDPVTTSPLIFREPTPVRDDLLLAGDAAGFIDPFTGDGISLALRSGALAAIYAAQVARGLPLAEALAGYAREYRARFAPVIRMAGRVRILLNVPRHLRTAALTAMSWPPVSRWVLRSTRGS